MRGPVIDDLDRSLVAVMFTDMVGYSALMQADEVVAIDKRDRYMAAIDREHAAFGGTVVQRLGDGSMSMFPSALAAVRAAVAIQRDLTKQEVPVRIGIHVGDVIVEPQRLTGDAVNIAARIESFAVAGGVMLSDAAKEQISNRRDVQVVSVGRFRLKNVGRPVELFAVADTGLIVPDPVALEGKGDRFASLPGNLPVPATPLVGREDALESLISLARDHRVVTVTGPGGVGKTRIIAELGRKLANEFLDGVAFVELAEVNDPADFLPAVADALDVKEAEGRSLEEGIFSLIGDRKALLLLDNLEQVVSAAPHVAALVKRCSRLHVVSTSRTPLRISSEHEFALHTLDLPPSSENLAPEELVAYPSVRLFVARAQMSRSGFELTVDNAGAVTSICRRLDGLPLALELAAARLRLLSPDELLERLDHALNVLTSGPRDMPERQQTLRATVDWSYSLLTESEQRIFRRMAVFAGEGTVADVMAVCSDNANSSLDDLESLVDKALVQMDGRDRRLRMLQTIAEYAREVLDSVGEREETARLHAYRYASVARGIRDDTEGGGQARAVERGILEEGNLLTALDTLLGAARAGDGAACEAGLQMCGDLFLHWHIRGKNITAREYASALLGAAAAPSQSVGRAGALITVGLTSWVLGKYEQANEEWSAAYRIAVALDAGREICIAAHMWGLGLLGFDLEAGLALVRESIDRSRSTGFLWNEGFASTIQAILHSVSGDVEAARTSYERALGIQRRIGDDEGAGLSLGGLAQLAVARGETSEAIDLFQQSLAAFESIGDRAEQARILDETAWVHLRNGDPARARQYLLDAIQAYTDVASVRGVGLSLIGLAASEALEGQPDRAVQIAAAAEVFADAEGIVNVYAEQTPWLDIVEQARARLTEEDAERAAEMGRSLTIAEAVDLARKSQGPAS